MWWEFYPLMELTPERARSTRPTPIGGLEPVGLVDEPSKRQADLAIPRSRTRTSTSAAASSSTRRKAQADPTTTRSSWGAGDVVAVDLAARTVDLRRAVDDAAPRGHRPARLRPERRPAGLAARARRVGRRARDRRAWTASAGARPPDPVEPPRVGAVAGRLAARARAKPTSRPRTRLALRLESTTLAIQGPPGSGKTLHRGADDRGPARAPGSGSGSPATSHKVIGNLLRVGHRGGGAPEDVRADPARRRPTRSSTIRQVARSQGRGVGRPDAAGRRAGEPRRRDVVDVGHRRRWPMRSTSCSSTRPGRSRSRTWSRWRAATDSLVLLGDPQQLDQPTAGLAPARRRPVRAGAHPRRARHDAARSRACSWSGRGGSIPTCAPSRRRSSTTAGSRAEPDLVNQRLLAADPLVAGVGPRLIHVATTGADNESPDEAERRRRARQGRRRGRVELDRRRRAADTRSAGTTSSSSRRTTPRSARSSGACRRRRAGRHGRQVPGPGGADQHLLDDDVEPGAARRAGWTSSTAGNRLNVATSRARCVAVVVALAGLSACPARGPRSRCGWRTRSAGSSRWPRRPLRNPRTTARIAPPAWRS